MARGLRIRLALALLVASGTALQLAPEETSICGNSQLAPYESREPAATGTCVVYCVPKGACEAKVGSQKGVVGPPLRDGECRKWGFTTRTSLGNLTAKLREDISTRTGACGWIKVKTFKAEVSPPGCRAGSSPLRARMIVGVQQQCGEFCVPAATCPGAEERWRMSYKGTWPDTEGSCADDSYTEPIEFFATVTGPETCKGVTLRFYRRPAHWKEPPAPDRPQPVAPVGEEPATPVWEPPATPVWEPPATPVREEPATPVWEEPATPVREPAKPIRRPKKHPRDWSPVTPVMDPPAPIRVPATPVWEEPATPVWEPATPVTPVTPVGDWTRATPGSEDPATPVREPATPVWIPETPIREPAAPFTEDPGVPIAEEPVAPVTKEPVAPITEEPVDTRGTPQGNCRPGTVAYRAVWGANTGRATCSAYCVPAGWCLDMVQRGELMQLGFSSEGWTDVEEGRCGKKAFPLLAPVPSATADFIKMGIPGKACGGMTVHTFTDAAPDDAPATGWEAASGGAKTLAGARGWEDAGLG